MRTLIISDIHANLSALDAVLEDAAPFDQVWCLGDLVGYGPDPNQCIERIRALPGLKCVKGNHDAAILGEIDTWAFRHEARESLEWLESQLDPENKTWLAGLEDRLDLEKVTLVHGSPRNPIWEYVMDVSVAYENMASFETDFCLVGHTHIPCIYMMSEGTAPTPTLYFFQPDEPFVFYTKSILNPGSVGQPRDHNPMASYLLVDDEQEVPWLYRRVAYDIEGVQKRILAAGLPLRNAARLAEGW
ncbi:MAG TPA: metallophosphoesterase [Anaerolineaceae bacterium]|jgi:predicted phosphodiesterase|nr:metallophosphoesterase [Anaerolineaceae bacterium]